MNIYQVEIVYTTDSFEEIELSQFFTSKKKAEKYILENVLLQRMDVKVSANEPNFYTASTVTENIFSSFEGDFLIYASCFINKIEVQ